MPGPGLCVVAVVVGVAAGIAFKEFVYNPHLAPKIGQWADAYTAYCLERRRRRAPPQSYSHVQSDEGESQNSPTKDDLEMQSLIEREMHTLGREGTLRQRKLSTQDAHGLEMLERPNPFVPFVPLAPSPLPPLSPTFSNSAISIGCLPASQSEETQVLPPVSSITDLVQSQTRTPSPASSPTPHNYSASRITPSASVHGVTAMASRGPSPFTSASISRAGTPWSDAPSSLSTDLLSGSSFSDDPSQSSFVSGVEHSYLNPDLSLVHAITSPQFSLSNQSEISLEHSDASFDTSFNSSVITRSELSVDFLESDGEQHADLADMRSPVSAPGILSDEEWERVSEAGRSVQP